MRRGDDGKHRNIRNGARIGVYKKYDIIISILRTLLYYHFPNYLKNPNIRYPMTKLKNLQKFSPNLWTDFYHRKYYDFRKFILF